MMAKDCILGKTLTARMPVECFAAARCRIEAASSAWRERTAGLSFFGDDFLAHSETWA
jgi:hypothetical protein